jgi:uncharacterized protein with GYD domain
LLEEGGTKRMQATKTAVESLGGTLEAFYFAYGDNDVYFIVDQPDNVNSIGGILLANSSGAIKLKTTVLITPKEIDQAVKKTMDWHPPGH